MEELFGKLGYAFKDSGLLITALTHPSYAAEHRVNHYQRLEFLGDAVLEMAISRYLYVKLPLVDEGRLTRIRQSLIREEALNEAAVRLGLGKYIRLSVGEERTGGREKPSILADVMEAIFAAAYLDGGFDCANDMILRILGQQLTPELLIDRLDAKSTLQERLQRHGKMPVYEHVSTEGPVHAPVFTYQVRVGDKVLGEGRGRSKQAAQQEAARFAMKALEKK